MTALILLLAFCVDFVAGDPEYRFHPVRLIGRWSNFIEKLFFKHSLTGIISGIIFWFIVVLPFISLFLLVSIFIIKLKLPVMNIAWQGYVVYSCFAFRDMIRHVRPIYKNLEQDNLKEARKSLKFIVGRDVEKLDKTGIIKASIESLAESFVDGYLSSVFWFVCGAIAGHYLNTYTYVSGGVFIILFRCSNTLDSMVGYQNERFEKFGKFSARMDDVLNFIPARISLFLMLPAIYFAGANVKSSIVYFFKDRLKSKSPNAAHPMSAFAGALGISLGGTATYEGYKLEKPVLGTDVSGVDLNHLKRAERIFLISGVFTLFIAVGILYLNP